MEILVFYRLQIHSSQDAEKDSIALQVCYRHFVFYLSPCTFIIIDYKLIAFLGQKLLLIMLMQNLIFHSKLNFKRAEIILYCAVLSFAYLCPTLCDPYGLQPPRVLCPWGFSRQEYCSGLPWPPPGDILNPGIKPRSPTLQVDSLSSEPPWKPHNTGVGSLTLLQGIFPTQESNRGLLHCRQILYQLSYQGSLHVCKQL